MSDNPTERADLSNGTIAHEWIRIALEHRVCVARKWLNDVPNIKIPGLEEFWRWWKMPSAEWLYEIALSIRLGDLTLTGHADAIGLVSTEEAIVIDWKYGEGQKYILKPIQDDLQMLAYACMAAEQYNVQSITVMRVRVSDLEVDEIVYGPEQLESGKALLAALVTDIHDHRDARTVGPHCEHCLVSEHCIEWREQVHGVRALMAISGSILTQHQAMRWAMARSAVKQAVADMDIALRSYLANGGVIEADGQRLCSVGGTRESVSDIDVAELVLIDEVGREATEKIIEIKKRTSKSAIERCLKGLDYKPDERRIVFDRLRDAGAIHTRETTPSLRWKKIPKKKAS
jgi:hypothetical protein